MKNIFCAAILLFGCITSSHAQSPVFVRALQNLSTNELSEVSSERPEDVIHRDMVAWTIRIVKGEQVQIDREAAAQLDAIYADASKTAAGVPKESSAYASIPANTKRLCARLISYAEEKPGLSDKKALVITSKTVELLNGDLKQRLKNFFCPCFPFC